MLLTDISIKRPVFATVMSIILVIFGLVVFSKIPVRELPNIDPSVVTVRTDYTGASAEIVDSQITQLIEDAVGGTQGIRTIASTSVDGRSTIKMEFEIGVNVDEAANDVRDAVSKVTNSLPTNASGQPLSLPIIFKTTESNTVTVWLRLRSKNLSDIELSDYALRYLTGYFSSVPGVGQIILSGEKQLSIRVWFNPIALASRDLTEQEVEAVLLKENLDFPAGKLTSKNTDLVLKLDRNYKNLSIKWVTDYEPKIWDDCTEPTTNKITKKANSRSSTERSITSDDENEVESEDKNQDSEFLFQTKIKTSSFVF